MHARGRPEPRRVHARLLPQTDHHLPNFIASGRGSERVSIFFMRANLPETHLFNGQVNKRIFALYIHNMDAYRVRDRP